MIKFLSRLRRFRHFCKQYPTHDLDVLWAKAKPGPQEQKQI